MYEKVDVQDMCWAISVRASGLEGFQSADIVLPDLPISSLALGYDGVEAENIFEVREIVIGWFEALEKGLADNRFPDPRGLEISQERADKFIGMLDDEFMQESGRFGALKVATGPEFCRLSPRARRAFAQQVLQKAKQPKEILEEAIQRVRKGEVFPTSNPQAYC